MKIFIGIFTVAIVVLAGIVFYNLNLESVDIPKETATRELSESKDGITATVTDVKFQNGKTIAMLTFNNHVYDISGMDVKNLSSFSNEKPSNYEILSTQMGGHHVESEMTFDGKLSGELIIGLNEDLIFNFDIK